jgi:hypothetical protein
VTRVTVRGCIRAAEIVSWSRMARPPSPGETGYSVQGPSRDERFVCFTKYAFWKRSLGICAVSPALFSQWERWPLTRMDPVCLRSGFVYLIDQASLTLSEVFTCTPDLHLKHDKPTLATTGSRTVHNPATGPALQIGTSDGRIKLIGTSSTEITLTSESSTPTASLHILPNTGCLLRLDTLGSLELWSITTSQCEATIFAPADDSITTCFPLPHDPYLLLGCSSGAVRVAGLLSASGDPLGPARPAAHLRLMPLILSPDVLNVSEDCPVVGLQTMETRQDGLRLMLLHEWLGVTIFSFQMQKVRLALPHS